MARALNKLTARFVATVKEPGQYGDGGGLYLVVDKAAARRWLFIYQMAGRRREMGLGSTSVVGLADARAARDAAKRQIHRGEDPIDARDAAKAAAAMETTVPFFGDFALEVANAIPLKRELTRKLWKKSVGADAPLLQKLRLDEINTQHIVDTLKPMMGRHPTKARKIRERIERVLDAARVAGHIGAAWVLDGGNPARWKGHLAIHHDLPQVKHKTKHFAALSYVEIGGFMARLRACRGVSARALEFTILTAARGNETRAMVVRDIDLEAAIWLAPDTKTDTPHIVPLVGRALELAREAIAALGPDPSPDACVFPAMTGAWARRGKALSHRAMTEVIERMKVEGITVHGFRSTFRDYAGDETDFPREIAEMCLNHAVGDETELSYRRSTAFQKRRGLMTAWDARCADASLDTVVPFRKVA